MLSSVEDSVREEEEDWEETFLVMIGAFEGGWVFWCWCCELEPEPEPELDLGGVTVETESTEVFLASSVDIVWYGGRRQGLNAGMWWMDKKE